MPGVDTAIGNTFLVGYDDDTLISKLELAAALKVSVKTIDRMVRRKQLPPPGRLGRDVWLVGRIRSWITRLMEQGENDAWAIVEKMR